MGAFFEQTVQPLYDGVGNRVAQVTNGVTTTFALDIMGLPEVIYTSDDTKYLHLPGLIMTENTTGTQRFLLSDNLGSVRQVVDEDGEVVATQTFDPYGNLFEGSESQYGFTGEWWEDDLELLHLRARWYMPEDGIFLSKDPYPGNLHNPQSQNGWNYVSGNVINNTDPSGLCEENGDESCWSVYENIIFSCSECINLERSVIGGDRTLAQEPIGYLQTILRRVEAGWRPLTATNVDEAIKVEASRYGVPWQIVAGVLESEIQFDTQWWDYVETRLYRIFPPSANLRPDPGPGIGNVHVTTAKTVSGYFNNYPNDTNLKVYVNLQEDDWKVAYKLTNNQFNIRIISAVVRQLADYRFGVNGQPSQRSHANLSEWTIIDGLAMWHGYRYGVPGVSHNGQGFKDIKDFQNRCYTLEQFINDVVQGHGSSENVRLAVPIFKKYFTDNYHHLSECC